jgi:hypothetical protein
MKLNNFWDEETRPWVAPLLLGCLVVWVELKATPAKFSDLSTAGAIEKVNKHEFFGMSR